MNFIGKGRVPATLRWEGLCWSRQACALAARRLVRPVEWFHALKAHRGPDWGRRIGTAQTTTRLVGVHRWGSALHPPADRARGVQGPGPCVAKSIHPGLGFGVTGLGSLSLFWQ